MRHRLLSRSCERARRVPAIDPTPPDGNIRSIPVVGDEAGGALVVLPRFACAVTPGGRATSWDRGDGPGRARGVSLSAVLFPSTPVPAGRVRLTGGVRLEAVFP